MFKNWIISILYFFGIFLSFTFLITIISYFNLLNNNIVSVLKLIIPIISIFISGYRLGMYSKKKGYLEGIKFGVSIIFLFMFFIFWLDKFSYKSVIYYIILLLTSVLSSMLGITRKKI